MQTQIVLLSAKQGAGKTSIQRALTELWMKGEKHVAYELNFADVIYEMHDDVLDVLARHGIKRDIKKDGPLLQLLGTEWGRATIGENIWVECLQNKLARIENDFKYSGVALQSLFVIGDCRFENEFKAFNGPEVLKVRLRCPEEIRKTRCSAWRENTQHVSETNLDRFDDEGLFDLYLDTAQLSVESCTRLILERIMGSFPELPTIQLPKLP